MISHYSLHDELPLDKLFVPEEARKINGSIVQFDSGLWYAYRINNFHNFNSANYLTKLHAQFKPVIHKPIVSENGNEAFKYIRLFIYKEQLCAIYTYYPKNIDNTWMRQYGVGMRVVDVSAGYLTKQQSFRKYSNVIHSKNWILCVKGHDLFIISDVDPQLRILRAFADFGEFVFEEVYRCDGAFPDLNFGLLSSGIPFIPGPNDGWGYSFVQSHIVLPSGIETIRYYFFMVIRFNFETWSIQYFKKPLGFSKREKCNTYSRRWPRATEKVPIKDVFPTGLVKYKVGILVSYGKDNYITKMKFYSWDFLIKCF